MVLVYGIAGVVTAASSLSSLQKNFLIIFLVVFPFVILYVFYKLVTEHYSKLYAPNDFTNEENFMKSLEIGINRSDKINQLENITERIQKQINEQPLYRYTKLSEAGKRLILMLYRKENIDISEFSENKNFEKGEIENQANKLSEFGWINIQNGRANITKKGKKDIKTFKTFVYGRLA